jgi:hypothetical protein
VLAVPYEAVGDAVRALGNSVDGKPLVDVTNALTPDMQLASGCTTSGADGGASIHCVRGSIGGRAHEVSVAVLRHDLAEATETLRPKYGHLYGFEFATPPNAEMVAWTMFEYR